MKPVRLVPSRSKYGNVRTHIGGVLLDSKAEARRFQELLLLEKAGQIRKLARQVPYELKVNGVLIAVYKADFVYWEMTASMEPGWEPSNARWREVVEDVKGVRTGVYVMKKKLMKACHGVEIREVKA